MMSKVIISEIILLVLVLAFAFFFLYQNSSLTGHFTASLQSPVSQAIDTLNVWLNGTTTYAWTPQTPCSMSNCTLLSVKITGSINYTQSGDAVISLENYKLFNRTFNFTATNETPSDIYYINDVCVDTCDLSNATLNKDSYAIGTDMPADYSLKIQSISYVWQAPQATINETSDQGEVKMDERPNEKGKPVNWFLKSQIDVKDEDSAKWEWTPIKTDKQGALFIDLNKFTEPGEWYESHRLFIFSKVFKSKKNSIYEISFKYTPNFIGDCVQIGMEVIDEQDRAQGATYMFDLGENGPLNHYNDFAITESKANGVISVIAKGNFNVTATQKSMFFINPACGNGNLYIENFTYKALKSDKT